MAVGALILAAAYGFRRWTPFRFEVSGASMRPTLEPGDWAIAVAPERVRPGDVVVFEHPDRPGFEMVKRVIRISGEPARHAWVEGDDPSSSTDSRSFGAVPIDLIRGRVAVVWWPPARIRAFRVGRA